MTALILPFKERPKINESPFTIAQRQRQAAIRSGDVFSLVYHAAKEVLAVHERPADGLPTNRAALGRPALRNYDNPFSALSVYTLAEGFAEHDPLLSADSLYPIAVASLIIGDASEHGYLLLGERQIETRATILFSLIFHGRADLAADVLAPGPGEGGGRLSAWIWAVPADCAAAYRPCLCAINLISHGYRPATIALLDAVT